ncbi:hypothetical protein [Levilactobacillus koreensis]|uniref:Uncharacterized protein n=1 Tax=Levilactobacillus koreensis TaxID=637971 RepID=A0AAC8UU68_9LACO|nr:hypothetical protein [Levilactobacillus koreensis]AKP64506.1 hypothetical protein ABN16_05530 [Levilactobacillus koreensis]
MHLHEVFLEKVHQTVDLLGVFICLLVPVFLVKAAVDFFVQGQLFWRDYGVLFLQSVGGLIVAFLLVDLVEVIYDYRSR